MSHRNYDIQMAPLYGGLERIELAAVEESTDHPWFNRTLCAVNDCLVRVGVFQGEFHWHQHDDEDELFYVVEGELFIDLEDKTVRLGPREGVLVPRTVRHRPRAPERTVVLMFEGAGVQPTGD